MKTYRLIFKPLGTISRFPDAQTIFGAVCNIILHTQGENKLEEYLQSFEKEPWFVHSSMFPSGLLPMVQKSLTKISDLTNLVFSQVSSKQIEFLTQSKKMKKIQWMSENIYKDYIHDDKMDELKKDINYDVKNSIIQNKKENCKFDSYIQLNSHVHLKEPSDNELYYDQCIYCLEDATCNIFVKSNLSKEQLENIFKYSHYFGFGSRHSVGKNSFKLIEIVEEKDLKPNKMKMLLSKSAYDDCFNLDESFYEIESKKYKTSKYYLNNTLMGRINLFKEGSYMNVKEDKEWYGKIIPMTVNEKKVYYYAIGLVL